MAGGHVPSRGLALGAVLAVWLLSSTICVVRARDAVTPSKPAECTANGTGLKVTVDVNTLQAAFACGAGLEKLWPNADNDLTSYCENNTCKATAKLAKTFGSGTTLTKNSATTYKEGPEAPSASSSATVYTLAVGGLLEEPEEIYFTCANKDYPQGADISQVSTCLVTVTVPQKPAPATSTPTPESASPSSCQISAVLLRVSVTALALTFFYLH